MYACMHLYTYAFMYELSASRKSCNLVTDYFIKTSKTLNPFPLPGVRLQLYALKSMMC